MLLRKANITVPLTLTSSGMGLLEPISIKKNGLYIGKLQFRKFVVLVISILCRECFPDEGHLEGKNVITLERSAISPRPITVDFIIMLTVSVELDLHPLFGSNDTSRFK